MWCSQTAARMPAPHETFGPAILRRPLRRIGVSVVVGFLHHPGLILVGQERQDGRHLYVAHPVPVLVAGRPAGMHVAAGPLAGYRRVGMFGGTAALTRLFEQRLVVGLGGLELIRAYDGFARIVAVANSPCRRRGRVVPYQARAVAAPQVLDRRGSVAAEIPRIGPEVPILVEIVGREEVSFERFDTRRRLAIARGTNETRTATGGRTRHLVFVQVGQNGRAPACALETRVRDLLRRRKRTRKEYRRKRNGAPYTSRHGFSSCLHNRRTRLRMRPRVPNV